jgi:hypothetical protein
MSRTRNTIRRKGLLGRFFEKAHGRKRQDCYGLYEVRPYIRDPICLVFGLARRNHAFKS